MQKLVISDDEGKTTVVPLVRDEITIGRKEGNTIRLTERNVSRRHARLRKVNGGSFIVEDLESYNGIKVNGRRIEKESPVKAGDQIAIGDYMLALQDESAADLPEGAATVPTAMPAAVVAQADTAMIVAPPVAAPVALRPPARLVMISPPAPGAEYAFSRPKMRIGRAEELDIVINHKSISREHAELERIADRLRIRDLGSANGTRVNGRDVSDQEIVPGDVIELGQVRFRFVGEGESYTLDQDRTVQMDAVVVEPTNSKAPLYIGAAIVAVALLGTVAFVAVSSGGGSDGFQATVTAVDPVGGAAAVPAGDGSDTAFATALAACQSALGQGQFALAQAQAAAALAIRPGDPTATQCASAASDGANDEVTFARASQALLAGSVEDAYFAFGELRTAAFLARPEVAQAPAPRPAPKKPPATRRTCSWCPARRRRCRRRPAGSSPAPGGARPAAPSHRRSVDPVAVGWAARGRVETPVAFPPVAARPAAVRRAVAVRAVARAASRLAAAVAVAVWPPGPAVAVAAAVRPPGPRSGARTSVSRRPGRSS
jgi:pSer/pThr/pTyr-binding forkhead associated (FHA) protein